MKLSAIRVLLSGVVTMGAYTGAWAQQEATGAGASFPAPLYSKWAADYHKATGVKINYQSVGSGAGLRQIEAKTVDFGASDAPLKDEELAQKGLVQFPTVIGGIVPVVNIKGIQPGQPKRRSMRTLDSRDGRPRGAGEEAKPASDTALRTGSVVDTSVALWVMRGSGPRGVPGRNAPAYFSAMGLPEPSLMPCQDCRITFFTLSGMGT